jgi:hypothetical protein
MLTVGGLGLAGGLVTRGVMGLPSFLGLNAPKSRLADRGPGPSVVTIPTPVYTSEADQRKATRLKVAYSREDWPAYYPGMVAAGLGGALGGYGIMDHLMQSKAKSDLASEEADAKSEYEKALLDQYDPRSLPVANRVPLSTIPKVQKELAAAPPATLPSVPGLKMASAEVMGELDELADEYEKQATVLGYELPSMGQVQGMYGAYAIPAAAASGLLAYNHFKDRSPNTLLEKAIKDRERARWASRPPETYAVPQPVHLRGGHLAEDESERSQPLLALQGKTASAALGTGLAGGAGLGPQFRPPSRCWVG